MYDKVFEDFKLESKVSPELIAKYVMMVKYKEKDIDCLSSTMKWFWNDLLDKDYTDDFF